MIRLGNQRFDVREIDDTKLAITDYDEEGAAGYEEYPSDVIQIGGRGLLLTDPTYLADVFNEFDSPAVRHLWENSLMLATEGFGPIGRLEDGTVLFLYELEDAAEDEDVDILSDGIGGDSGTVMLLPLDDETPKELAEAIRDDDDHEVIYPPAGRYRVGMIQGTTEDGEEFENIVLQPLAK